MNDNIKNIYGIIENQERMIRELRKERDRVIRERDDNWFKLNNASNELNGIYRAKAWKIVDVIWKISGFCFPRDSAIRNLFNKKGKNSIIVGKKAIDDKTFNYHPKISIIMPVYNVKKEYLKEAIDSVLAQTYENWELCIVDDASTDASVKPTLEFYAKIDPRIKVQFSNKNGHIAVASNKALSTATGEYVGFLDNDDMLCNDTLFNCVQKINACRDAEVIYTDNFTVDDKGQIIGHMIKPDWSPETYLSTNYMVHFCLYTRNIIRKVNGLDERIEYRGTQDTQLKIKIMQITDAFYHIPQCLYKWRIHVGSVSKNINQKRNMVDNSIICFKNMLAEYYKYHKGKVVMPSEAQQTGIGYFSVIFPLAIKKTLIIIPVLYEDHYNRNLVKQLLQYSMDNSIKILLICKYDLPHEIIDSEKYFCVNQNEENICAQVKKINAENIIILSNQIESISLESIRNIEGYLDLSEKIGACGGKVFSHNDRLMRGAYLLMDDLQVKHYNCINTDNCDDLYAQNYSAVSGCLMGVRKEVFLKLRGLNFEKYGDLSDVDFCLRLRKENYRVVYNPRAAAETNNYAFDNIASMYNTVEYRTLYREYKEMWGNDPYYSKAYSQKWQYALN